MKFEKLKRLYEFVDEFKCEMILEIQNVPIPCKFIKYQDIDKKIELLEKGDADLILFEPGFEVGSKYIQIDSTACIYMKSSRNKKIIIAKNLDELFSKFTISFQYLPTVKDVLRKKRRIMLYLDEQYTTYDIAKLIEQATKEATPRIEIKHIMEAEHHFIEFKYKGITKKLNVNLKTNSFLYFLNNELNPYMQKTVECDFKYAIVHENTWDNKAKIVLVTTKDYRRLLDAHLIMEEANFKINEKYTQKKIQP